MERGRFHVTVGKYLGMEKWKESRAHISDIRFG
jgi:hypothetical protein